MLEEKKIAYKVSIISIVVNIALSIFKFLAGILSHSSAMVSDSIHSISDVVSTIIVIIGVKLSNKEADKEHPYGHEKIECIASLLLAIILFITGLSIGYQGIMNIINKTYLNIFIPGILALIAAIVSIAIKEAMYWYTRYYAKKINSTALMADAWHHRSDALSSIGSFIGILASRIGFPICDSVATIVICIFIVKASIDILMDAINRLIDKSCDTETIEKIKDTIMEDSNVINIDSIMTRLFGNKIYVDVEIELNRNLNLVDAHEIAEKVHEQVEKKVPTVKHCMVHVNPSAIK